MAHSSTISDIKVADEVWIVTAMLHKEHPERPDFTVDEIVARAKQEGQNIPYRAGIYVHIVQHCVANRPPNPGRYRMLFETGPGRRRLFRKGDTYHPEREGSKITPRREDIPFYDGLLNWYNDWSTRTTRATAELDPLLALRGSGKKLWADEHADEYVRRLREGWE
ncbi:MAG: hypothetical protein DMG65_18430 [Candidatus Angelobacter sp. Gp1-AA117]|nr:MAG: hypothetical protein DMG65_18430 [Candidatus Angelobacter sp. Gp1-AA117]